MEKPGKFCRKAFNPWGLAQISFGFQAKRERTSVLSPHPEAATSKSTKKARSSPLKARMRCWRKSGIWPVPAIGGCWREAYPPEFLILYYARVIDSLNARGAQTILDTSGAPLRLGCMAKPFLVKPNLDEANTLTSLPTGTIAQIAAAAGEIRRMGPVNVILSMEKTVPSFKPPKEPGWPPPRA